MKLRHLSAIFFIACAFVFAAVFAVSADEPSTLLDPTLSLQRGSIGVTEPRATLMIYQNSNGRVEPLIYSGTQLAAGIPIQLDGYVAGIILLGVEGTQALVNNQKMASLRRERDGSYDFDNFDRLGEFKIGASLNASLRAGAYDPDASFRWIDNIPANAVSQCKEFTIAIKSGGRTYQQVIRQAGCYRLDELSTPPPADFADVESHYFGTDTEQFRTRYAEYTQRLASIMAGVHAVEAALNRKFVRSINLIDYSGAYNALTKYGCDGIWFYLDTFWNEPVTELRRMAEHETLHIVTDLYRLPANIKVRELFAELKGYDLLSLERFSVVTTGALPINPPTDSKKPANWLFDFINEKNFIKGARGGHSQDNLDEFCTSFLHTLMYRNNLAANLMQPAAFIDRDARVLSDNERRTIMNDYVRTLDTIQRAAHANPAGHHLSDFLDNTVLSR